MTLRILSFHVEMDIQIPMLTNQNRRLIPDAIFVDENSASRQYWKPSAIGDQQRGVLVTIFRRVGIFQEAVHCYRGLPLVTEN